MKFTRSLPANAMARANVPSSTSTLNTSTFRKYSPCIMRVDAMKHIPISIGVFASIYPIVPELMKDIPFIPLNIMK